MAERLGLAYVELDLDKTKFEKQQQGLQKDISNLGENVERSLERSFQNLNIKTDQIYQLMANKIIKSYERISQAAVASASEQYRAYASMVAKINAMNIEKTKDLAFHGLGIRSSQEIATEMQNVFRWYDLAKQKAAGNAAELARIEEAKNARIIALENELGKFRIANEAKAVASAKASADAKRAAQEKWASEEMAARNRDKAMMQLHAEALAENAARTKAIKDKAVQEENSRWQSLNIRSKAAIEAQRTDVLNNYNILKAAAAGNTAELVRLEKAKNEQIKALNKELAGEHEMSMAAMTRAVLRFYAAYYVISNAFRTVIEQIMDGVKAIDDMKISSISVAAQITSMQGNTGDITENYRKNLEYARALIPVLMEIDAASFANYGQIQKMNMAMTNQGIILDVNNQKQIEAFTALTNAVALFTSGQDKEKQATQEIRSLMSGRIRQGDMVAMQMDALVKKQGEYKGGLKELVEEGKKHGDTLERMLPYLTGIVAASGDIGQTWEAVSSSFETAWGILERGIFKNIYKDLTEQGQKVAQYMKDNADEIVKSVENAWRAIKFAGASVIATLLAMKLATVSWGTVTGSTLTWLSAKWKSYGLLVSRESAKAVGSMNKIGVAAGVMAAAFTGWGIGTWLSDEFEVVRKAGVYMVYGIADLWAWFVKELKEKWEVIRAVAEAAKAMYTSDTLIDVAKRSRARIAAIKKEYEEEKAIRDQNKKEQLKDVTDAAIAAAKAKAEASKRNVPDIRGGGGEDSTEAKARKAAYDSMKRLDKNYFEEQNRLIRHNAKIKELYRANEYDTKRDSLASELILISEYYSKTKKEIYLEAAARTNEDREKLADATFISEKIKVLDDEVRQRRAENANAVALVNLKSSKAQEDIWKDYYRNQAEDSKELHVLQIDLSQGLMNKYEASLDRGLKAVEKWTDSQSGFLATLYQEGTITWEVYAELAKKLQEVSGIKTREVAIEEELKRLSDYANFYAEISGYESEYYKKSLEWINKKTEALKLEGKTDVEIAAWAAQKKKDYLQSSISLVKNNYDKEHEFQEESISNAIAVFDNASYLMDKESKEYELMQNMKKAMQIAELAMTIQKNLAILSSMPAIIAAKKAEAVAAGGTAIVNQGSGDPYTAFARIAAMTAIVTSVLAMAGIAFGSGSSGGSVLTPTLPKSTVLGAADGIGSESIQKSWELLEDTYSMEYRELSGIYNEVKKLNNNITGLVTSIIRTGGINVLGGKVDLASSYSGWVGNSVSDAIQWISASMIPGGVLSLVFDKLTLGLSDKLNSFIVKSLGSLGLIAGGQELWASSAGLDFGDISNRSLQSGNSLNARIFNTQTIRTTTDFWRADTYDTNTYYTALNANTSDMLDKVFKNMGVTLIELATSLGTDIDAAMNYVFKGTQINLQGMDADTINKTISEYFSNIGDTAVEELFGSILRGYQEVGEGLMETATRIVIDKALVIEALEMTGQSFTGTMKDMIAFSESIIKMAGDLETFTDAVEKYYDKFFTDEEKHLRLQTQLTETLADINLALPSTRLAYRQLVESLNLNTETGQKAYYTLISLSESADQYYSTLEEAMDDAISKQKDYIATLEDVGKAIQDWINNLKLSELAPVVSESEYNRQYAMYKAKATLSTATGEDVNTFLSYATKYLEFQKSYGTATSYQAIYDAVLADVTGLGEVKNEQLEIAKQQLAALNIIAMNTSDNTIRQIQPFIELQEVPSGGGVNLISDITEGLVDSTNNAINDSLSNQQNTTLPNFDFIVTAAEGTLTSGITIAGEAGPEWIVPTYEPQKSKFLKSVGLDPNTLGAAIASKIGNTGGEVTVHTHVYLDGVEIQDCVAKGTKTNQNLIEGIRRIR